MDPATPIETLCRIILRAREYEAQVPTDYDGGEAPENVDGEDGDTLSVLDDEMNSGVEEELTAALDDLAEDQLIEVLAFCWVGQGTYDATEWDEALEEAGETVFRIGTIEAGAMGCTVRGSAETWSARADWSATHHG